MSDNSTANKITQEITSALSGGLVGFFTGGFLTTAYGLGYVLTNWLGGSDDLQIIGGIVTTILVGAPLTAVGFFGGAAAGMLSRYITNTKGSIRSAILGGFGGFILGIYVMSLIGALITFG